MNDIIALDSHTIEPRLDKWSRFEKLGTFASWPFTSPDQVIDRARGARALLVNKVGFNAQQLGKLPDLKYIGVMGTGYDLVDIEAAAEHRIVVTNIPHYGTDAVAQHTFALLLQLTNRVAHTPPEDLEWHRDEDFSYFRHPMIELAGKTMGIIGMGEIGKRVAFIARAFGMKVLAYSSHQASADGVESADLDELCINSDIISIHSALTAQTKAMLTTRHFDLMQKHTLLLNTSRGAIIDEAALIVALQSGKIAGAGLDVLAQEPPHRDNPLLNMSQCIVTPHIAWITDQAGERLMDIAWRNLKGFYSGQPSNMVNAEHLEGKIVFL